MAKSKLIKRRVIGVFGRFDLISLKGKGEQIDLEK